MASSLESLATKGDSSRYDALVPRPLRPTQHLIGNVLVDSTQTTATSTCYVQDLHTGRGELTDQTFSTLGEYRYQ
ncbi:nuclear transport factor 2 family protein [Mycobacterium sp. RTGN5]|uniref:nuclear transport factor 2 family protein n=1 Tax=Mycobacterium sp. RTGN5 TaxID=3016522 RepID=UPI0029C88E3F|nr:nuclear transport factor 2 family protein [Mycobacterium sp. RTGN5]